jgi:Tfp pilus assembly protein PilX
MGASSSRAAALSSEGCSQDYQSSGSVKTTGMRSWTGRTSSFAWQVMIVQLGTTWPSGKRQRVQRPAKQKSPSSTSAKWRVRGCS